jgi:hypothetical protein
MKKVLRLQKSVVGIRLIMDWSAKHQVNPNSNRSDKPMDDNILPSEVYKGLCEVLGCFAQATGEIKIAVGHLGTINLLVCNNCIPKFTDYEFVRKERKSDIGNDGSSKYISS